MSRRESKDSDPKRQRSRIDREPSPKRSRRDGKPEAERFLSNKDLDVGDGTVTEHKPRQSRPRSYHQEFTESKPSPTEREKLEEQYAFRKT
ncbi:PREDICTED: uncharacterized protein LOC104770000 isoform X2 [Camelina sativa]|uniref:Uncharacterized protein LOC104770000 isoform X2 n=1 Tax=Camelina sativa TaxID=90675 RepID=A0ABM1RFS7_CAMSA|nr:PREDICTED: uncharacterized protein LOC104770000 isoform X2 [Camelina sativa]